jgi:hypothetical protein
MNSSEIQLLHANISNELGRTPTLFIEKAETSHVLSSNYTHTEINDIRSPAQFRGVSFSKYKKTEVRKHFVEAMMKGKIEHACNWCAELICAGHYVDVWEVIFYYMAKHIHLGNPKIVIYLEMRYEVFRNIMGQGFYLSELEIRNNEKIRKLFAEIICTLTLSPKKPSFEPIKINRAEEFDMTQMTDRLKAPNMSFAEPIFKPKDPKEIFIAVNEFAYSIACENPNMISACYWIEWVIEFDQICKGRKQPCRCEKRNQFPVESKYQRDPIWMFWETLFYYSSKRNNPLIEKTLGSLQRMFCVKYTTASCKKRRYMLYYAIGLLTEAISMNVDILPNRQLLQTVVDQIDEVYKQIKKNEETPKTEYLFRGLEKQRSLEKSLMQMEIVGQLDTAQNLHVA